MRSLDMGSNHHVSRFLKCLFCSAFSLLFPHVHILPFQPDGTLAHGGIYHVLPVFTLALLHTIRPSYRLMDVASTSFSVVIGAIGLAGLAWAVERWFQKTRVVKVTSHLSRECTYLSMKSGPSGLHSNLQCSKPSVRSVLCAGLTASRISVILLHFPFLLLPWCPDGMSKFCMVASFPN